MKSRKNSVKANEYKNGSIGIANGFFLIVAIGVKFCVLQTSLQTFSFKPKFSSKYI